MKPSILPLLIAPARALVNSDAAQAGNDVIRSLHGQSTLTEIDTFKRH
jgi:hypothetical protein